MVSLNLYKVIQFTSINFMDPKVINLLESELAQLQDFEDKHYEFCVLFGADARDGYYHEIRKLILLG